MWIRYCSCTWSGNRKLRFLSMCIYWWFLPSSGRKHVEIPESRVPKWTDLSFSHGRFPSIRHARNISSYHTDRMMTAEITWFFWWNFYFYDLAQRMWRSCTITDRESIFTVIAHKTAFDFFVVWPPPTFPRYRWGILYASSPPPWPSKALSWLIDSVLLLTLDWLLETSALRSGNFAEHVTWCTIRICGTSYCAILGLLPPPTYRNVWLSIYSEFYIYILHASISSESFDTSISNSMSEYLLSPALFRKTWKDIYNVIVCLSLSFSFHS